MKKIFFILLLLPVLAEAQIITTLAGAATPGYSGDGGNCVDALLNQPQGIVADKKGNLYFAELGNNCIRKIDKAGIISTVAGNGSAGYGGDNGPATAAMLNQPHSVAIDTAGNLYIGDYYNYRVRKINAVTGIITTIAGTGTPGYNGTNIPATDAQLNKPSGVAVDDTGNVYISDYYNNYIRKINAAGTIINIAGTGAIGYSGDHSKAIYATMREPYSVAVDHSGNVYITDIWNYCIRKIDPSGIITTVAGNGLEGYGGDGSKATRAELNVPQYTAIDNNGNLYIADATNCRIRKVDTSGMITTIAGNGTPDYSGDNKNATAAALQYPAGVAVDGAGNIYIADQENNRIRFIASVLAVDPLAYNAAAIHLYPDPAHNTINVTARNIENVVVVNMVGRAVYNLAYKNATAAAIDISDLDAGIYFVKINGVYGGKFLKQ